MGKFNPLSLMSRLISINPPPEDQMAERGRERGREREMGVGRGEGESSEGEMLPPNFYDTESLFNGLEDSSHLASRRNKRELVGAQEKWFRPVKSPSGLEIRKL